MNTSKEVNKTISWLEVSFKVPSDWELVADSGGITEAYMRIDSPSSIKLELKWERVKKKMPDFFPYLTLDNYIKSITKDSKQKVSPKILEKGNAKVNEHKAAFYRWQLGSSNFVTISWFCELESKIFLLQYTLDEGEDKSILLPKIVKSISCHTNESFYSYEIFNVSFEIPKEFHLLKRNLAIGKAELHFLSQDSKVLIMWIGLANYQIKKYGFLGKVVSNLMSEAVKACDSSFSSLLKTMKPTDNFISLEKISHSSIPVLGKATFLSLDAKFDEISNKILLVPFKTNHLEKK
ncbi:MAG: hypothetical protein JTT14_00715, partial [Candidatus Brockarchaeota archaeon]|nr:hypothetical protein [Candidatus Brockarchaeota archaeon]